LQSRLISQDKEAPTRAPEQFNTKSSSEGTREGKNNNCEGSAIKLSEIEITKLQSNAPRLKNKEEESRKGDKNKKIHALFERSNGDPASVA
jgi:hypothetical protein